MATITLKLGNSFDEIPKLKNIGAVVCDPPYLISFMGKSWDDAEGENLEWFKGWLQKCYDILPSGGVVKVFCATRTFHRLAQAMNLVGFQDLDLEAWVYGCLSEDTEILTNCGWVPYHKAKLGTQVLSFDPRTRNFLWQAVEETFEYEYDREAFHIRSDNTDQIVSVGHRIVVERDGEWVFIEAQDAFDSEIVPILPENIYPSNNPASDVQPILCEPHSGVSENALVRTQGGNSELYCVRNTEMVSRSVVEKGGTADLFAGMQWGTSGAGLGDIFPFVLCGQKSRESGLSNRQNDGTEQPCMERWGDLFPQKRELHQGRPNQVCSVPCGIHFDGPEGRVCHGASTDSRSSFGQTVGSYGNSSSPKPQSCGQSSGKFDPVCLQPGSQAVRTSWVATAYLGRSNACIKRIHYTGIVWCVKVGTGAFVARRNGKVFVTGNSGFPKSMNLSKAIDQHLGKLEEREVLGDNPTSRPNSKVKNGRGFDALRETKESAGVQVVTAAATEEAKRFEGWGTALKPAWEPFIVGYKP